MCATIQLCSAMIFACKTDLGLGVRSAHEGLCVACIRNAAMCKTGANLVEHGPPIDSEASAELAMSQGRHAMHTKIGVSASQC